LLARRLEFGHRLRVLRAVRSLTQERLGERAGLDRKTVNRIENGRYSVSLDRIFLIADALQVHPGELFGLTLARGADE
jgi:transcriptional regulator with XRE-family HTH domain